MGNQWKLRRFHTRMDILGESKHTSPDSDSLSNIANFISEGRDPLYGLSIYHSQLVLEFSIDSSRFRCDGDRHF